MPGSQFYELPHTTPLQSDYKQVALEFIQEYAPSLPADICHRLACGTVSALFGAEPTFPEGIIDADPYLSLNRSWVWPELALRHPFNLEDWFSVPYIHCLWDQTQHSALDDARNLDAFVRSHTMRDWVWNSPMTQVRQWRNQFLPDRPKKGRKVFVIMDLLQTAAFLPVAQEQFEAWRAGQLQEVARLLELSKTKPIARHLYWLATLVFVRLRNYHSLTNSMEGPEAFALLTQNLVDACKSNDQRADVSQLMSEARGYFPLGGTADIFGVAKDAVLERALANTNRLVLEANEALNPAGIRRILKRFAPGKLLCNRECNNCQTGTATRRGGKAIGPFNIMCTCSNFSWVPKTHSGSQHDWDFHGRVDLSTTIWALDRLLNIGQANLDYIKIWVKAQSELSHEAFEREWTATRTAQLDGRKRR